MTKALKANSTEGTNRPVATRRTKRKADDVDKSSTGSTKKRLPAKQARNNASRLSLPLPITPSSPAKPSATKRSGRACDPLRPRAVVSKPSKPPIQGRKKALSEEERKQFSSLMQKVNIDKDLISAVHEQLEDESGSGPRSDGDVNDVDGSRPLPEATSSRGRRRAPNPVMTQKDLSDNGNGEKDDELGATEFETEQRLGEGASDEEEDAVEKIPDDLILHQGTPSPPGTGESEDEQEVSFHDGAATSAANSAAGMDSPVPEHPNSNFDDDRGTADLQHTAEERVDSRRDLNGTSVIGMPSGLGSGAVDESVVVNTVQALKGYISSEMKSSLQQIVNEFRTDRDQINKLREHISELTELVTTTASAMFFKQTASQPRGKELQRKLCLLPAVFNDQLMLKILSRVVIGFLVNNVPSESPYAGIEAMGVQFFSTMYFSKKPNETKKEKFTSEVGKFYSKFRYSLLTTSILALQDNSFKTFRAESMLNGVRDPVESNEAEESSTVGVASLSAMTQPFWLRPGYISGDHCLQAAEKQEKRGGDETGEDSQTGGELVSHASGDAESLDIPESSQSSGKQKGARTGPINRTEIAVEAASMVYKIITAILYRSRLASKTQLFHDVTYLFTGWSQHGVSVQQTSLKMEWETPKQLDIDYIDNLPRTKIMHPNARHANIGQEVDKIDFENVTQLEKLISHHQEFSLVVQHSVMVTGTEQTLKYRINLIEIVSRLLASYVTLESAAKAKDALCSDKRCFKALIVMATGLRRLMEKAIIDLNASSVAPWSQNHINERKRGRPRRASTSTGLNGYTGAQNRKYVFENVNGMDLEQLLPSRSKQKEILSHMILTMTQEEYETRTLQSTRTGAQHNSSTIGFQEMEMGIHHGRIQADDSQCVFRFS